MTVEFFINEETLWFILPLVIIQLSVMVIALFDWFKKKSILGRNKVVWLLIIAIFSIIGPFTYLVYSQRLVAKGHIIEKPIDDWGL